MISDDRLAGAILLGDTPRVGTAHPALRPGLAAGAATTRARCWSAALGGGDGTADSAGGCAGLGVVCECNNGDQGRDPRAAGRRARGHGGRLAAATRATTGCGSCTDAVDGLIVATALPGQDR